MDSEAKANQVRIEQQARTTVETFAHDQVMVARLLFTTLVLGLLAALVGAWVGTRHKRTLYPGNEQGHASYTVAQTTRPAHGTDEPARVSVYDSAGNRVS